MNLPQPPIADPEARTLRPALGLVIAASIAVALWAAIIEAFRLFG